MDRFFIDIIHVPVSLAVKPSFLIQFELLQEICGWNPNFRRNGGLVFERFIKNKQKSVLKFKTMFFFKKKVFKVSIFFKKKSGFL